MKSFSVVSIMEQIPTETDAYLFMERLRWNGTPQCPHCGNVEKCYFLTPVSGPRTTSTGASTQRRLWKCASCRKKFSVLTNTVMHGSKIPVRVWVLVMFEMCASKNGVSAREIERKYSLTPKSAWFLTHRVREGMKRNGMEGMFSGVVAADETFIGGKESNKHRQGRGRQPVGAGARASWAPKVAVLSLIDKETGEARSAVVRDVTGATLRKAIAAQVDMSATTLHTDAAGAYKSIAHEFAAHQYVDHSSHEYVRYTPQGVITSNQCENFFSQLKRSIDGTHHSISAARLPMYLAEHDYRYSTRKESDSDRMRRLVGQIGGRRLTYRALIES